MIRKVGLVATLIFAAFLLFVAFQNSHYVVSRKITINAPSDKVFPYLNNSKLADQWGPWREEDPEAQMILSGPESGVGSMTIWEGGKKLGKGSATIVESVPNQKVAIKLVYEAPMNMTQQAQYLITSLGNQTEVEWRVEGQNNYMGRLMCFFVDMDKMVGKMFEKGLTKLKGIVESQP